MAFNVKGLLSGLAGLPNAIGSGLLGPMPTNPGLGLDPQTLAQSRQQALSELAMGLMAGDRRNPGGTLMAATQNARQGYQGRVFDLLKENETARMMEDRKKRDAATQQLLGGMQNDPMMATLAAANPEMFVQQAIQAQFTPGADGRTDDIKEYEKAVSQGYTGTFQEYMTGMKKAGASSTNVTVGGAVIPKATDLAVEQLSSQLNKGRSAARMINTGNNIRALMDEGVITGTGAEARLIGARATSTVGISDPGVVSRTEAMRSQLAEASIVARERLKGQGQITEGEQKMLDQAIGRDPSMSEEGINQVLDLIERAGRTDIADANTLSEATIALNSKELGALRPQFIVKEPPTYRKKFDIDGMGKVEAKLGMDGKYYYVDPKTKKRYRIEE